MLKPETRLEWAFVGITAAQAIVIISLQTAILVKYLDWVNPVVYQVPVSYITPVASAVSIISLGFQAVLSVDSCRIKNKVQLWTQCILNICFSISIGMEYFQVKGAAERVSHGEDMYKAPFADNSMPDWDVAGPLSNACIAVSSACSLCMCALAYSLHMEFSWSLYEHISPDLRMTARHAKYLAYLVFLKVSLLLLNLFLITYGLVDVHYREPEFGLTMAIIPVSIIHAILSMLNGDGLLARTLMKEEMLLFASFALSLNIVSVAFAVLCVLNFGKGLKPLLQGQGINNTPTSTSALELSPRHLSVRTMDTERISKRFDMD
ncbi:glycoside hydrolase [Fusarium bulbicola]|nr:glycoside hydrolase [Fusarium bulbicola]